MVCGFGLRAYIAMEYGVGGLSFSYLVLIITSAI